MLDKGAATSKWDIVDETIMRDALEINLQLRTTRERYNHVWGTRFSDTRLIRLILELIKEDAKIKSTIMAFFIVDGDAYLIRGNDVKRYVNTWTSEDTRHAKLG